MCLTYDNGKDPLLAVANGIFHTSLPDGASVITTTMIYAKYTPYGIALLDQK